jgi:hypothetical protein
MLKNTQKEKNKTSCENLLRLFSMVKRSEIDEHVKPKYITSDKVALQKIHAWHIEK